MNTVAFVGIWTVGILLLLLLLYFLLIHVAVSLAFFPRQNRKNLISRNLDSEMKSEESAVSARLRKEKEEIRRWEEKGRFRRVTREMPDGSLHVAAILEPHKVENRKQEQGFSDPHLWVILIHGYYSSRQRMYSLALAYSKQGWNCLIPDLRAQGESGGKAIGMGLTEAEDCREWTRAILEMDKDAKIVVHGRSMGAATTLFFAEREDLDSHVIGAVADSSYSSAWVMLDRKIRSWSGISGELVLPAMAKNLKIRGGIDLVKARPVKNASGINIPLLLIHGSADRVVPVNMVYRLARLVKGPVKVLVIRDAEHVQAQQKNPKLFYETLWNWLHQVAEPEEGIE